MKYTEEELIEEIHKISKEYCNGNTPRTSDLKNIVIFLIINITSILEIGAMR